MGVGGELSVKVINSCEDSLRQRAAAESISLRIQGVPSFPLLQVSSLFPTPTDHAFLPSFKVARPTFCACWGESENEYFSPLLVAREGVGPSEDMQSSSLDSMQGKENNVYILHASNPVY